MVIWMKPPHRARKRKKSIEAQAVLDKLQAYLDGNAEVPVKMLCGFWKDQQDAITYQEIREAVKAGMLDEAAFQEWARDYSVLVARKLEPVWERAMAAGAASQTLLSGTSFTFNTQAPSVVQWISQRGAAFVTACSEEQKKAISSLLAQKVVESHTVDELARLIRPCIGLTDGQSKATLRYYDNIAASLRENHPRMKPERIQQKAADAAMKYAERQHRQRAVTIAQTEMAFAYNRGADEGIRQAQAQNLIGAVEKRWSTSGDENVCSTCEALDGIQIGMEGSFGFAGRELFEGQDLLPPAHPRCGCAVMYIEVEKPVFAGGFAEGFAEGNEQNYFTNVPEDGMMEASNSAMAEVRKPRDAVERSCIINDAINAEVPRYAADLRRAYERYGVRPLEGYYDVVIHGAPHFVEYEHRYILDTETLYYIISGRKDYHMEDIRLLSCSTGKADEKGNCVAQELADMLGVNVYAPIDVLNFHPNGTLTVGKKGNKEFKLFKPRR